MTCMPRSYCSFVGFSPILAKWPLTDMIEGAVGCRVLLEGRRGEERVAMTQAIVLAQVQATKVPELQTGESAMVGPDACDVAAVH